MLKHILNLIKSEYSGERAREYTLDLARYHRVQASPGFRQAATYVNERLAFWNLDHKIHSYPADGKTTYWGAIMFEEWDIQEATLDLIEPEPKRLADFSANATSVIQRSAPFQGEVELVLLENGEEEGEYEGLDLSGKAVLTNGNIHRVSDLSVEKYGAVGIIYDGLKESPPIRGKLDLPRATEYSAFWWNTECKKAFGFVISPRQGAYLREQLKKSAREKKAVRIKVKVEANFYAGNFEVVEAFLPGESEEEILLLGHLCHPRPSTNDNASGSAALLETVRTLNALLKQNLLPPLKRGLRFLWVPEMSGTYAYLASNESRLDKIIAGVNLDMVGEKQEITGSTLRLVNTPMSMPSFVNTLMSKISDCLSREDDSFDVIKGEVIPTFKVGANAYSGGSDHFILTDPSVGIPCLMLGQWPDLFYHTSEDTADKIDPWMLKIAGVMSATYAYFIANATLDECSWLGQEIATYYKKRILTLTQKEKSKYFSANHHSCGHCENAGISFTDKINFLLDREINTLSSLTKLNRQFEVKPLQKEIVVFTEDEIQKLSRWLKTKEKSSEKTLLEDNLLKEARLIVPEKKFPGPLFITWYHQHHLTPEDKELLHQLSKAHPHTFRLLPELALFWVDGKRNLLEISQLVELECGKQDLKLLLVYFKLLAKQNLIILNQA